MLLQDGECEDLDDFDINIQIDYNELEDFNEYEGCEIVVPDGLSLEDCIF